MEEKKNDACNDNPYCLPPRMQQTRGPIYGARLQHLPLNVDPMEHVKNIQALELRNDDVFILAYPKSGTHWLWEITSMLLNQSTDHQSFTKEYTMLEFNHMPTFDTVPSPRIINSHLFMSQLPKQLVTKKIKIMHMVRNPKDVVVSFYHHLKQIAEEDFQFDGWLKAYMSHDQVSYESQFNFLRNISQFQKENPDHPILHVHYEELKREPGKVIKQVAEFLGAPASELFCEDVAAACSFDVMKKVDDARNMPQHLLDAFKIKFSFYRKGAIGDWKNLFTITQNEVFDDFIAKERAKGLDFQFTFE